MQRVLIAEPRAPVAASLRQFLGGLFELTPALSLEQAAQIVQVEPPELIIAPVCGELDGEVLCAMVRKLRIPVSILLVYAPDELKADERARAAQANGFLVGPLKKMTVVNAVQQVLHVRELKERIVILEAEVERQKAMPRASSLSQMPKIALNQYDEQFFKKYLLLEMKRSKRYLYPSSLFICAPDDLPAALGDSVEPVKLRAAIIDEAVHRLAGLLRDIDVVLPFGEDRLLVFLPHTPRGGATVVAKRALEKLRALTQAPKLTYSIGMASFDPKHLPRTAVSFGALVREANLATKRAHAAGGNAVEVSQAFAPPKRDRISIG